MGNNGAKEGSTDMKHYTDVGRDTNPSARSMVEAIQHLRIRNFSPTNTGFESFQDRWFPLIPLPDALLDSYKTISIAYSDDILPPCISGP